MSTTATASIPQPPIAVNQANKFNFTNHANRLKVTYYPIAPGPPQEGVPSGPELSYEGPEGTFNFRGQQIAQQDTPMGALLSVVLTIGPAISVSSTTFSLFLPPVSMGSTKSQTFTTYAVKTEDRRSPILATGTPLSYEVERLHGDAQIVAM